MANNIATNEDTFPNEYGMNYAQRLAILRARKASVKIAKAYPEIADEYRGEMSQGTIAKTHDFASVYSLSTEVARRAVEFALEKLITPDEMERLASMHRIRGGNNAYSLGKGVFSMTHEAHQNAGKKGAEKMLEKRGIMPWLESETSYLRELCENQDYRISNGMANNKKIAEELNRRFETNRTTGSVYMCRRRMRKASQPTAV